ncbi:hypothetical protein PGTUg99_035772 [Puccinia graminis f. sp. tritici]|uniref:Uncharacterized protein n=1 Tax=Puccinia graminis f. sp. tritici TaxID=56615 RepID=A0A5B0RAB9_PUCGR|nr:hypothetical protein PGTUg99_035772 [Puccinia graminis f. sp. tritici]
MLLISGRAQIAKEYIIELRTPSKSAQEEHDEITRYPPSTLQNLYGLKFRHLNFIGTAGPH